MGHCEADAEFDRGDRQPALSVQMFPVPGAQQFPPPGESARLHQPPPNGLNAMVADLLAVMRGVRFSPTAVKVARADDFRIQPEPAGDAIDNLLDHQHALWSAE